MMFKTFRTDNRAAVSDGYGRFRSRFLAPNLRCNPGLDRYLGMILLLVEELSSCSVLVGTRFGAGRYLRNANQSLLGRKRGLVRSSNGTNKTASSAKAETFCVMIPAELQIPSSVRINIVSIQFTTLASQRSF